MERSTIEELSRKYDLHPTQINTWKREAVGNMAAVFSGDKTEVAAEKEQQNRKAVCPNRTAESGE
jgi:transposase